jgi:hypothetical protein
LNPDSRLLGFLAPALFRQRLRQSVQKRPENQNPRFYSSLTKSEQPSDAIEGCQSSTGLLNYENRFYRTRKQASSPREIEQLENRQGMDERLSDFGSPEVGIKIHDPSQFRRHFKKDIYLAAIYGRDFSFCGDPA